MAAYNAKEIFALPNKERRLLAKKLWKSLDEHNVVVNEDKETLKELEQRWQMIMEGKIKTLTPAQFWSNIEKHRSKKK
jgi:putative addiction module component (TIGR02574 family)